MSPVVSLDVLPADVPAEYAPAMVTACSEALADGRCAMAQNLPESTRPEAVALVLWQGDAFLQVTVRVGRGGAQWVARALTFSETDSVSERWTTVGLTIATLVGETRDLDGKAPDPARDETRPQSASARPESPATLAPNASTPPSESARRISTAPHWQVRLAAVTGPGWDAGAWRVGGWASLGFRLARTPLVLSASGSFAVSDGPDILGYDLASRWTTLGLGVGLTGAWPALNVAGSALLEVSYRRVDVDFRGQSLSDEEVPVSLRGFASYPAHGTLAATAGFGMRVPPNNPNETSGLRVQGATVSAEVLAGLEVRL